jgi:hypothetical protein
MIRGVQPVRKWSAALALLALALQLALSFGHMHSRLSGIGALLPDECAICASVAITGSSALPEPVALKPPPVEFGVAPVVAFVSAIVGIIPHLSFQTRAPPLA